MFFFHKKHNRAHTTINGAAGETTGQGERGTPSTWGLSGGAGSKSTECTAESMNPNVAGGLWLVITVNAGSSVITNTPH